MGVMTVVKFLGKRKNLTVHQKIHTDEKNCECDESEKEFSPDFKPSSSTKSILWRILGLFSWVQILLGPKCQ